MFNEKNILRAFDLSLWLKALHAIVEIASGILVYIVGTNQIVLLTTRLTQGELTEEPNDFFANFFLHSAQSLSAGTKTFAALYLLFHGLLNLGIVLTLWRDKLWSYPVGLGVTSVFMAYQLYRLYLSFSLWLFVLTLFDLVVMWLIYHEYRLRLRNRNFVKAL